MVLLYVGGIPALGGCASTDATSVRIDAAPAPAAKVAAAPVEQPAAYHGPAPDAPALQHASRLAAEYLIRSCDDSGRFAYKVHPDPAAKLPARYNLLRHAGATYALAQYEAKHPDEKTRETLVRAVRFLRTNTIRPLPKRNDLLAVWSDPKLTGVSGPVKAKLGGTGLGLVALLGVEKVVPGTTPPDALRKMGRFLLFMQRRDGSFVSRYVPAEGGKDNSWTSLYYPGEAALGLLMLYEKDKSPAWLQGAADAIGFLARTRAGKAEVPDDHWALIATAKLLPLYDRCRQPCPRKQIVTHAVQICEHILSSKATHPVHSSLYGGFTDDGRTCPTATRLEGLLAALTFLPAEQAALRKRIESTVTQGMRFLLRTQIRSGALVGGIPRAAGPLPAGHPRYDPSFNARAGEVRIDYVQHALCAMIQYQEQLPKR